MDISPKVNKVATTNRRHSASFIIREMEIQSTMRHHFIPTGMAITIKKKGYNNHW